MTDSEERFDPALFLQHERKLKASGNQREALPIFFRSQRSEMPDLAKGEDQ
jgi:hypothetical protein